MILLKRVKFLLVGLICFTAISAVAQAEDRFAIAIGVHEKLAIIGPKGDKVAELSVPTIAQIATVGDVSFQVSYGRDVTGRLAAIISPSETAPAALHFNVLGKAVDADKAVVTLTFASNLQSVTVDPGYGGTVEVNSHRLRKHSLSDDAPMPRLLVPHHEVATESTPSAPVAATTAAAPAPAAAVTAEEVPAADAKAPIQTLAPATLASQLPAVLPPDATTSTVPAPQAEEKLTSATPDATADPAKGFTTERVKLYWAEPVTNFDGTAPSCGVNEIKLVELTGSVSVTLPDGQTQAGAEGMTIPTGSSVATNDNSSVAVFFGGINSARLMPRCDVTVTQTFDGSNRTDLVDLRHGAVFGRIGQRDGEIQDFKIKTAEGVTSSDTPNLLAFRGTMDDIPAARTAMNSGLLGDKGMLAWNPPTTSRNLMSDVPTSLISVPGGGSAPTTAFFYAPGATLSVSQVKREVIASNASNGQNSPNATDPNTILQGILLQVAPLNQKLNTLLGLVNSGTATKKELAFYHGLVTVFFNVQVPNISTQIHGVAVNPTQAGINATLLALLRDLRPFNIPRATPF